MYIVYPSDQSHIDSDDCSGFLAVKMSVNIESLELNVMEGQPILRRIQNFKPAKPLTPIATIATTPSYCDTISSSASNQDIKEILSKMESHSFFTSFACTFCIPLALTFVSVAGATQTLTIKNSHTHTLSAARLERIGPTFLLLAPVIWET